MKHDRELDDLMVEFIETSFRLEISVKPCPINGYFPLNGDETNLISAQIGHDLAVAAKGRDVWYHQDHANDDIFFFIGSLDEVKAAVRAGIEKLSVHEVMVS